MMKSLLAVLALSVVAVSSSPAHATERTAPGSLSYYGGVPSPFEATNLHVFRLEQGFDLFKNERMALTPFVAGQFHTDSSKFDWNNKMTGMAGVKTSFFFKKGQIDLGGGYTMENRTLSHQTDSGAVAFGQWWFGWQPASEVGTRFPGSTWASVGNISPVERGNVLGSVYLKQGVVATRINKIAVVPFVEGLYKADSKKFDYNNALTLGAGAGLSIPVGRGVLEGGAVYRNENRTISHEHGKGLAWFANFWYGWTPAISHKDDKEGGN